MLQFPVELGKQEKVTPILVACRKGDKGKMFPYDFDTEFLRRMNPDLVDPSDHGIGKCFRVSPPRGSPFSSSSATGEGKGKDKGKEKGHKGQYVDSKGKGKDSAGSAATAGTRRPINQTAQSGDGGRTGPPNKRPAKLLKPWPPAKDQHRSVYYAGQWRDMEYNVCLCCFSVDHSSSQCPWLAVYHYHKHMRTA